MKNKLYNILLFLLIGLSTFKADSSKLQFEKITIEQGLSQRIIITIFQDSKGFLWVGTQEGLNKYDGYKFTQYKNDPANNNTISDNYVRTIIEDKENNLWIATNEGGLNKFDPVKEKFITFLSDSNNQKSLSDNNITSMVSDSAGNLWLGTYYSGFEFFDSWKNEFIHYNKNNPKYGNLLDNHITSLCYDNSRNYLWIGTYKGLNLLDLNTGKIIDLNKFLFNYTQIENHWIRDIALDKDKNVLVATDTEGLFIISDFQEYKNISYNNIQNFKNHASDKNSISANSINSICRTNKGEIYLGTWGGGLSKIIKNETGEIIFENWLKNPQDLSSISENDITCVYEDNSNVLWIGTYGDGLNKLTPHSANFTHYKYNPFTKNSLSDNQVTAVYEDDDENIWIGTWSGLNKFDRSEKQFTHFNYKPQNFNSISGDRVTSIIKDKEGFLWIGTLNSGLNKFNPLTEKFTKYLNNKNDPNSISTNRVLSLCETSDGKIWIGTYFNGVDIYNKETNTFEKLDVSHIDGFDKRVNKIFEEPDGTIWIGTYKGIYKYNPFKKIIEEVSFSENKENKISSIGVVDINSDSEGNIWLGTFGEGIYKFSKLKNSNNYSIKHYDTRNGLINNYVHAIQFDSHGYMWASTRNGLCKFNIAAEHFETFTSYEGLEFNEFSNGSFYNNVNGNLYFCGLQGLIEFNPNKLEINYSNPQIAITSLKIFNKPASLSNHFYFDETENSEIIILKHDENSVSIEFAALDYIAPSSTSYKYKLEGFDEHFISVESNNRVATYTNLPSGDYIFRIIANLGSSSSKGYEKDIFIKVIPPFWEQVWFRTLIVLIILLLFYGFFYIRTLTIRKRNEELKKEVKLRTKELEDINAAKDKFFSIIAHDLKAPFSYLLSNSEYLAKEVLNLEKEDTGYLASNINIATSNIYNLLENLLQWSKFQMMGLKMEPRMINLPIVVMNNISLVEPHANQKGITIEKNIQEGIEINSDENIINTILRNLLMNAIKFTRENGTIKVSAFIENKNVVISVSDSGIGMSENQVNRIFESKSVLSSEGTKNEKGTGLGLYLIKEFIEAINGELKIDSLKNKGTTVTCVIPADNN